MSEDGLLEEDIWEYKSIRKPKSVYQASEVTSANTQESNEGKTTSQSNGSQSNRKIPERKSKPNKTRQRGIQASLQQNQNIGDSNSDHIVQSQERISSAKPKKNCKNQSPVNTRPVYEGYCPSCQMPFSLLLVQTPQWHVTECLDSTGTAEKSTATGKKMFLQYSFYQPYSCVFKSNLTLRDLGDEIFSVP